MCLLATLNVSMGVDTIQISSRPASSLAGKEFINFLTPDLIVWEELVLDEADLFRQGTTPNRSVNRTATRLIASSIQGKKGNCRKYSF